MDQTNILEGITAEDGVLWRKGRVVSCDEADHLACKMGFLYAEQLVKHLSDKQADQRVVQSRITYPHA